MLATPKRQPSGMPAFLIIWIGQFVSILASGMSGFALSLWIYQQTQSATAMGLMHVFYITPFLILSPIAGVMIDRYSRKLMMAVSDTAAFTGTLFILAMYLSGHLQFWHLYIANILYGLGNTFQWPAYSAAISTMIPKEQYGRANGLMSLLEAGPGVIAPLLAGILLPIIGLAGILTIDVVTFVTALLALLAVFIPQPIKTEEGEAARGSMLKEAGFGFTYIFKRPSLLGLQLIFFAGNLFSGIGFTVLAPMVLARTNQNSLVFGSVETAMAIGGVLGGVVMSAWGGFKRRVNGVLLGWMLAGVAMIWLGVSRGLVMWVAAQIFNGLVIPLVNTSNQSIWQAKVAPDLQGRVFSARRLIAWFTQPIAPIIGGTLADFAFEPAFRSAGFLPTTFSWLVGTGPGAGMGLLFALCGIFAIMVGLSGYFIPAIRQAETILPDHTQQT